jgi:hypothetical protein
MSNKAHFRNSNFIITILVMIKFILMMPQIAIVQVFFECVTKFYSLLIIEIV